MPLPPLNLGPLGEQSAGRRDGLNPSERKCGTLQGKSLESQAVPEV